MGKASLLKFKRMIVKLKWSMKLLQPIPTMPSNEDLEEMIRASTSTMLVPKGHFAVLAGEERFVLELRFLRNPAIVKLLNQAEEEFGYQHEGALVVPCNPHELQMILLNDNNYL